MAKHVTIIFIFIFNFYCGTAVLKTADYNQTAQELKNIIEHDTNINSAQKIVLSHAYVNLKQSKVTQEENVKLQKKVVSESGEAGAGRLMYWILGILGLGIVAFIISKFAKFF